MKLTVALQLLSAPPAIWAAWFWWRSARVRIPGQPELVASQGSLEPLENALKLQSRYSALAALGAMLSALLQAGAGLV